MKFTELLQQIQMAYREQPRVFHVIATRYYLGAETLESLRSLAKEHPVHSKYVGQPILSDQQVQVIIDNR